MSLLDEAFWEALDAAQGNEDAAFPILKRKLANPSPPPIQELRWLRSKYADDTDDILKEALGRFAREMAGATERGRRPVRLSVTIPSLTNPGAPHQGEPAAGRLPRDALDPRRELGSWAYDLPTRLPSRSLPSVAARSQGP